MNLKNLVLTVPIVLGLGLFSAVDAPLQEPKETKYDELNIAYSPKVINSFYFVYENAKKEIPMCLDGFIYGNQVFVHDSRLAFIIENSDKGVKYSSRSCDGPYYIGMAHNHPEGGCMPSMIDIDRFEKVVACEHDSVRKTINTYALGKKRIGENIEK